MTLLENIKQVLDGLGILNMTTDLITPDKSPPETYVVVVPISDTLDLYGDDRPSVERNSALLSLYTKGNYTALRRRIRNALLNAGIDITFQVFIEKERDTGYYHYEIDVESITDLEE